MSALVAIGGCVMVGISVKFYTDEDDFWGADLGDMNEQKDEIRQGVFAALLVFSIIAIFVGGSGMSCVCGPCTPASDKCCYRGYPIAYGTLLSFIWLVYFIVGGIVTAMATQLPDEIQNSCKGEGAEQLEKLAEYIETIDESIGGYSG
jgi:hypothetical protein